MQRRARTSARGGRSLLTVLGLLALALAARWLEHRLSVPIGGDSVRVIDGDSLVVDGTEVRLQGIDAPEGPQTCRREGRDWACGEEARRELKRLIGTSKVECRVSRRDQHGRSLSRCTAGGKDLNRLLVEHGYALAYGDYEGEEQAAKAARRGIWGSEFQSPRDWRRARGIGG